MAFENYPSYAREIADAYEKASSEKKNELRRKKIAMATGVALIIVSCTAFDSISSSRQATYALDAVSGDIQTSDISVETSDTLNNANVNVTNASHSPSASSSSRLSSVDKSTIADRVRNSLTETTLGNAYKKTIDSKTSEAIMTLSDGTKVVIKITKDNEGSYTIDSITAIVDDDQINSLKSSLSSNESSQEQKDAYSASIGDYNDSVYREISGLSDESDETNVVNSYSSHLVAITDNVSMIVPDRFSEQEGEQQESGSSTDSSNSDNDASIENDSSSVPCDYSRTWRNDDGSALITAKSEKISDTMSSLGGFDAVTKLSGYWKETSLAVAQGIGQSLKDNSMYQTETFYDPSSDLWGYWGHVELLDGDDTIVYDRLVLVNEDADRQFTVSYRWNGNSSQINAKSLDDFKKMFSNAPSDGYALEAYSTSLSTILRSGSQDVSAENN